MGLAGTAGQGAGRMSVAGWRGILMLALAALAWGVASGVRGASDRFPQPEFESGYAYPTESHPLPQAWFMEPLDVLALALALGLAAWLVLRVRRRGAVFLLMLAALAWFGFWKRGCVCSVGSLQNVAEAAFGAVTTVSLPILAFFLLPLLAALLWGRVFCGAVCPLGAIQDLAVIRPLRVPSWLEQALGLLAVSYLLAAVVVAVCGGGYLICRWDPFVGLFRLAGPSAMLAIGVGVLLLGTVVARPYCRYLCPYGVLLRWCARLSWRRVTVTPDDCVQCRLCRDACPFGAIREPDPEPFPEPRRGGARRLAWLLALLPAILILGGVAGYFGGGGLSRLDPRYRLGASVWAEDAGLRNSPSLASAAFRASEEPSATLHDDAARQLSRYRHGGALAGMAFGLVVGLKLIGLAIRPRRRDFEPDRGACLACGRCFQYCPREQVRRQARHPAATPSPEDAA